jgi:hypothetical protein
MAYQHGVASVSTQLAVGFVDKFETIKYLTGFEIQGLGEVRTMRAHYADTVFKTGSRHRH